MDAVYTLGTGTTWGDRELLFSLRSLQEFVPDVDRVIIVGERPAWLQDIVHVPARDPHKCKERNIMEKVLKACHVASPRFLFMNDDHFALAPQRAADLPFWKCRDLADLGHRLKSTSHYRQALLNTDRVLRERGLPVHNYDIHTPIVYEAAEFPRIMASYDWTLERGFVVKSLYANTRGVTPTALADSKLSGVLNYQQLVTALQGRPWWSTSPASLTPTLKQLFAELYQTPSRWEVR